MTRTTHAKPGEAVGRAIIMRLRVEPDANDTRSDQEIADAISEELIQSNISLPDVGIAIATLIPDDPANRPRRVG